MASWSFRSFLTLLKQLSGNCPTSKLGVQKEAVKRKFNKIINIPPDVAWHVSAPKHRSHEVQPEWGSMDLEIPSNPTQAKSGDSRLWTCREEQFNQLKHSPAVVPDAGKVCESGLQGNAYGVPAGSD
ncbi:hypothetical protein H671_8g19084 [Cricetulus griseus]|nr:hypothetical protein H671_8g19084 [Cricetulus griseus]